MTGGQPVHLHCRPPEAAAADHQFSFLAHQGWVLKVIFSQKKITRYRERKEIEDKEKLRCNQMRIEVAWQRARANAD